MLTGLLLSFNAFVCLRAHDLTSEGRKEVVFLAVERAVRSDTPFVGLGCLPLLAWRVRFWSLSSGSVLLVR